MAVARDNFGQDFPNASWGSGTSFTFSYAITSGVNSELLLGVFLNGVTTNNVTGATFNATAMANLGFKATLTNTNTLSVWGLKGQSGTHNVVVSISPSNPEVQILVNSWTGVDQTTPTGTVVSNNGTGTAMSVNGGSVPANGVMVGFAIHSYSHTTLTQGQTATNVSGDSAPNIGLQIISNYSASVGTLTYTAGNSYGWAAIAIPLNAAGGSSVNTKGNFFLLLGP